MAKKSKQEVELDRRNNLAKDAGAKLQSASFRVRLLVKRLYIHNQARKPIEQLTDAELLSCHMVGPKSVAEIRDALNK